MSTVKLTSSPYILQINLMDSAESEIPLSEHCVRVPGSVNGKPLALLAHQIKRIFFPMPEIGGSATSSCQQLDREFASYIVHILFGCPFILILFLDSCTYRSITRRSPAVSMYQACMAASKTPPSIGDQYRKESSKQRLCIQQ